MNDDDDLPRSGQDLVVTPTVSIPAAAITLQFSRSSGPGGQNVNKLSTKAELWLRIDLIDSLDKASMDRLRRLAGRRLTQEGLLHLSAQSARSQEENRRAVLIRLRTLIRASLRPVRKRKKTKPTKASRRRRLESKKQLGQKKNLRRTPPSTSWD